MITKETLKVDSIYHVCTKDMGIRWQRSQPGYGHDSTNYPAGWYLSIRAMVTPPRVVACPVCGERLPEISIEKLDRLVTEILRGGDREDSGLRGS